MFPLTHIQKTLTHTYSFLARVILCIIALSGVISLPLHAQLLDTAPCPGDCPLYELDEINSNTATSNTDSSQDSISAIEKLNTLSIIAIVTSLAGIIMSIPCMLVGIILLSQRRLSAALILIMIGPIIFAFGTTIFVIAL